MLAGSFTRLGSHPLSRNHFAESKFHITTLVRQLHQGVRSCANFHAAARAPYQLQRSDRTQRDSGLPCRHLAGRPLDLYALHTQGTIYPNLRILLPSGLQNIALHMQSCHRCCPGREEGLKATGELSDRNLLIPLNRV